MKISHFLLACLSSALVLLGTISISGCASKTVRQVGSVTVAGISERRSSEEPCSVYVGEVSPLNFISKKVELRNIGPSLRVSLGKVVEASKICAISREEGGADFVLSGEITDVVETSREHGAATALGVVGTSFVIGGLLVGGLASDSAGWRVGGSIMGSGVGAGVATVGSAEFIPERRTAQIDFDFKLADNKYEQLGTTGSVSGIYTYRATRPKQRAIETAIRVALNSFIVQMEEAIATLRRMRIQEDEFNANKAPKESSSEGPSVSIEQRLSDLRKLLEQGLITEQEFAEKKKEILNSL